MSADTPTLDKPLPESLARLAELLQDGAHLLTVGDESISQAALLATKEIFDLALACEPLSHPHLHPFLASILETPAPTLRSSTLAKTKGKQPSPPPAPVLEEVLPYTPLGELTVEGMEPEQVWQQLELRTEGIGKVVKEVGAGEGNDEDEDEEGEGSSDEEDEDGWEDGSDEEMTIEEFKRMMAEQGIDDEDEEGSGGDSEDEDEEGFRLRDQMSDGDEDEEEEDDEVDDEEEGEDEDEDEDEEEVSDGDEEDDGDEGDEYDQLEMDGLDVDMGSDEDDIDEATGFAEDDQEVEDDLPGPSRRHRHPTLDDEFFSIDDFNRMTEEAEAGRLSSGRLGGEDDDDDGDIADIGSMMLSGRDEEEGIMYTDFFDAPKRAGPVNGQGKGKGKSKSKVEKGKGERKGKGKGVRFGEEEEDAEMNEEEDDEEEDAGRGVMGRVKGDLFDDDEEEQQEQILSTHEKQQLALAKQIAELEGQAIGPKDWTLLGEASSRARPENSLLEEDLDFEQVGKVVPVITDEVVQSLEEMIKKRIIDNNFDSTVRVRAYEPTPFLPSRYFELQDTQSSKSLAQIYEEEYQAAAAGGKVVDARDEKLKKEHEEIDKIWSEICYKLDALSSLNFVPKQPKASITTITNLPTTSMESALPPTSASTTLLAPEELFNPPTAPSLVARSELTPEEAQRARQRARKVKQSRNRKLGDMAELYGKKKGAKAEKEEALKNLVKGGKGVTVVGKGDKEAGKARKRQGAEGEGEREDGKRLKL